MSDERFLCICADDFGLSEGIDAAALELAERGRISAIGCMVRRNFWHTGSRELRHLDADHIDIGLHLDLDFPSAPDGRDGSLASLVALAYLGLLKGARLRDEIRFQLSCFEDRMGRAPAFIDGHRHVHQLPGVRDLLVAEMTTRYRHAPPWLRNTAPTQRHWRSKAGVTVDLKTHLKAKVIHALGGRELQRIAAEHSIPMSRSLLGVYTFPGNDIDYQNALVQWIVRCRSGDVLMCHPSLGGMLPAPHDESRRREYLALRALDLTALHATSGIAVAPLSRVFGRTPASSEIVD
jgi:predicted glycoside hydrolase/deacetylase ChbG (UPF0249 family)